MAVWASVIRKVWEVWKVCKSHLLTGVGASKRDLKPLTETIPQLQTSMVIISALYPLFQASSLNSRHFSVFLWMAASKAVSKHTVSSMRLTSFGFLCQMTISGQRSVVASWSGYWYIAPGRLAMMFAARGRCGLMKSTSSLRTELWRLLYRLNSRATWQLLRMWRSFCFLPHSLQSSVRPSLLCQMDKFKLWGRVSDAALRANFRLSDVTQFNNLKDYMEAMHYQRIMFNCQSSNPVQRPSPVIRTWPWYSWIN